MADTPIDTLIIDIEAKAQNADGAIDSLCKKIDTLTTSISKVDVGKLNSLAGGIQRLGVAAKGMQSIDKRSFEGIATKINELSAIDTSKFATVSANLHQMANGMQSLGTVSANVASVGELAKNISKLGNKSVQTAVTNIPQLATALNGLMNTLSHAPKVSQNVIQMTNALANLSAQGSKVGSASNSIVKGLNRASTSTTRANKSFKGLASAFGRFYANCFLVIRGVKSLWKSINSTADYLEAFNYFEVALNKVGGDWAGDWEKYSKKLGVTSAEEYANSFKTRLNESLKGLSGVQISIDANGKTGLLTDTGMKNLGLNIQEVTQYASQLASVTNSVGQTGEVTLAAASAFTKLGADMSSLFNVDYSSVMNNLQSGLIGQSRALYKYGIDITNATLQTYAYELGVEKAVSEMTQAEKMQLRMIAILDQSRVSWGDASNTINSLSNSIRQFKNNISEAGQILGQLFVPIMSKLMPIINGVTIAIKRLMVSVAGIMGIKLDLSEFGQGTSDITDDMDGLGDSLDGIAESAKEAKAGLRGFDELNVISTSSDSGNDISASVGGLDLTQQILDATAEYEAAWQEAYERMENKAMAFADKIEKSLEPIKKIFQDFTVGDFFQAGQDVSNLVVGINDFFARAIDSVDWYGIGTKIGDFLAGIDWIDVLSSIGNLIWQAINAGIELWNGAFDAAPIETSIIAGIALLKWTGLGNTIFKGMSKAILSGTLFKDLGTLISGGLLEKSGIIAKLADVFALTFGGAGSLSESFETIFGTIGAKIAGIGTIISGVTIAVTNFFSMWRNGFDWLNEALMVFGTALTAVGAVILGAPAGVAGVAAAVVAAVGTAVIAIRDNWDSISDFLINAWNALKEKVKKIADWFNEKVAQPIISFVEPIGETISSVFEGAWIVVQAVWKVAGDWFGTVTEPIRKAFVVVSGVIGDKMTDAWNSIKGVWSFASSWINNSVVKPIKKIFDSLWGGLKSGAVSAINGIIGIIENMLNFFVAAVNEVLKGFNKVVVWAADVVGKDWGGITLLPEVTLKKVSISGYEVGGFPKQYSMFMAGENGIPEIVGTVGGRTAVAGGAEITGISDTIRETSSEEIALLRQQNALLQALLEKEVGISKNEIGKAAQSWARDYSRRTGREAYSF